MFFAFIRLKPIIWKIAEMLFSNSLLRHSTVGYPSDSLASYWLHIAGMEKIENTQLRLSIGEHLIQHKHCRVVWGQKVICGSQFLFRWPGHSYTALVHLSVSLTSSSPYSISSSLVSFALTQCVENLKLKHVIVKREGPKPLTWIMSW